MTAAVHHRVGHAEPVRLRTSGRSAIPFPVDRVPEPIGSLARRLIATDLGPCTADVSRLFDILFADERRFDRGKCFAAAVGVGTQALGCRFYRAGLPSLKRYMVFANLVFAADLLYRGVPANRAATILGFSTRQHFHHHVKAFTGLTSCQLAAQHTGTTMLELFREQLVLPHAEVLRSFEPFAGARKVAP